MPAPVPTSFPENDSRATALNQWFKDLAPVFLPDKPQASGQIEPVSGDASFRRYFRGHANGVSYILMDAPPELEDCGPFLRLAGIMREGGVNVPLILASNQAEGFICLEDFGSVSFLDALGDRSRADALYGKAFGQLLILQKIPFTTLAVPAFDRNLLMREMALFRDWLCERLLQHSLGSTESRMFERLFTFLCEAALGQPVAGVHRDFHSRNLMERGNDLPGVIDFQDAVLGPVTYDLVSLLRDCYISWPDEQVDQWVGHYHQRAGQAGIPVPSLEQFRRDFDLMGVQRHLKASGIFARLWLRDGKPGYLKDIPRTLGYILALKGRYAELDPFVEWCGEHVQPRLQSVINPEAGQ